MTCAKILILPIVLLVASCQGAADGSANAPGTSPEGFTGIAPDETIRFTGTEPFWGGEVTGNRLTYSTPENIDGTQITVERFTGQGGLGFAGTLDGAAFDMTVTPGDCSDQMSDRTYPFTVTLQIGDEQRSGCAYTDAQPFEGPTAP